MAAAARPLIRVARAIGATSLKARRRNYHTPVRDMRFQLYTVHDFEKHYKSLSQNEGEVARLALAHSPAPPYSRPTNILTSHVTPTRLSVALASMNAVLTFDQ